MPILHVLDRCGIEAAKGSFAVFPAHGGCQAFFPRFFFGLRAGSPITQSFARKGAEELARMPLPGNGGFDWTPAFSSPNEPTCGQLAWDPIPALAYKRDWLGPRGMAVACPTPLRLAAAGVHVLLVAWAGGTAGFRSP